MNDFSNLIQADIFFFVSTIATVILTVVAIVISAYIVGILRDIRHITHNAKKQSDFLAENLEDIQNMVKNSLKAKPLVDIVASFIKKKKNKEKPSRKVKVKGLKKYGKSKDR